MFRYTKNGSGETVVSFEDRSGDEVMITFCNNGSGAVEIDLDDCAVFTKEQAIAVANLILEQTKGE